jgi:nucleoside 2-deoxyribosyltransferase
MSKSVYLAGPAVFHPAAKAVFDYLMEICTQHGLTPITPQLGEVDISALDALGKARAIRRLNMDKIVAADVVIACISPFRGPGADAGTAWEMGYAEALGKPVVAWCESPGDYKSRVDSAADEQGQPWCKQHGMLVEDFGLADNLMLTAGTHPVQSDFEAAVKLAASL